MILKTQFLYQKCLRDCIPKNAKKNYGYNSLEDWGNSHALITISSLPNAWILDSIASHLMVAKKYTFSYLKPCTGPPILMGDGTPVKFCGQGRVYLENGCFQECIACSKTIHKCSLDLSDHSLWHRKVGRIHPIFSDHLWDGRWF
jgi:hypothetical protein